MSTEVQPWEDTPAPVAHLVSAPPGPAPATSDIDSWVAIASAYTTLANQIAYTDFPPVDMRGKPEALVATFLMGREQGLGPMTALMNLHVIKGKVGQSAHLMRAMILAAGHEFDIIEASDSRVVARGRRRGEHAYVDVAFTADQARRAKIDLGGYPEDKLVARATARLARRKFADVIAGMAYSTEELGDGDFVLEDDAAQAAAASVSATSGEAPTEAKRTAKRPEPARSRRATSSGPTPGRQRAAAQRATSPSDGPPLPGEEEARDDEVQRAREGDQDAREAVAEREHAGQTATAVASGKADPETGEPAPPQAKMVTKNQLGKLGALFSEAKVSDRAARLRIVASIADRDVKSSTELTQDEASQLIDDLQQMGPDDIAALAGAPAKAEREGGEQGALDEPVDAEVVEDQGDAAQGGEG